MWEVFKFECRYQVRSPLFWSVSGVFFLLALLAMASDSVSVGGPSANLKINASYVIMRTQQTFSILGMFAGIAFVAGAITRDYEAKTAELFFSSGISPAAYLLGRFWGGYLFAALVLVAALLGTLVGELLPVHDAERLAPFTATPYVFSLLAFVLPNALIFCTLFFAVAALTRSMLAAYLAALAFLVLYITLQTIADAETLTKWAVAEPFGSTAIGDLSRYWTVSERNFSIPSMAGVLLHNRLLWVGISLLVLLVTTWRYRFELTPWRWRKAKAKPSSEPAPQLQGSLLAVPEFGVATVWQQLRSQLRMDLRGVTSSVPFYVLLAFGALNLAGGINFSITEAYGTSLYPITAMLVRAAAGSFSLIILLVIVYYSGELVHRERQTHTDQIVHATPYPSWIMVLSKVLAMWFVVTSLLLVVTLMCLGTQLMLGFDRLEPGLLLFSLFVTFGLSFYLLSVLAVVVQTLSPNKFLGMLFLLVVFIGLNYVYELGFEHVLYNFDTPSVRYSDMNGFGHYLAPFSWISAYWLTFCGLLLVLGHLLFPRGAVVGWSERLRIAGERLRPGVVVTSLVLLLVFAGLGGYIFYNTNLLNTYETSDQRLALQAEYEQTYKSYESAVQLEAINLDIQVDIYPEERRLESRGSGTLVNPGSEPLSEFIVSMPPPLTINSVEIEGASLVNADEALHVYRYEFAEPLPAQATVAMTWDLSWRNDGFQNSGSTTRVVGNGTFVNNAEIMPTPGYDGGREIGDPNERREYDLPEIERMPKLGDERWTQVNQLGIGHRSSFRAQVSTTADQIAIAPGYLVSEELRGDRKVFTYEMDAPIWPFVSFVSARFKVQKSEANGVALEVYYDAKHEYNVETMLEASADALAYFSEVFSPYQYRQFRILEFPRYQSFAQSFPNTIPYSEAIGFVADLSDPASINYVYYVTAHEAAHQWWAHQVVGARMQGATVIVETLAQYSALMVMEKRYGKEKMRRFLKFELDSYLRSRGGELIEELPLKLVENQGYIHYRKGSLVMYTLKEAMGEEALNRALKRFVADYAFQGAPFPSSEDLLGYIRSEAGPEHQALIRDLFEQITIYDLAVDEVLVESVDGAFDVSVTVSAKKMYADGKGVESEVSFTEPLQIALFPAEPENDESFGDDDLPSPLLLVQEPVSDGTQTFVYRVNEKPDRVGIDPYLRMIDRNPENNLKRL